MRLGFAGTPEFAVPALDAIAARHDVRAVFTQPDRPAGRGRLVQDGPVKVRAMALGIPVHQPARFDASEALEALRSLTLDALIVVAYGLLLPPAALALPRFGCLNIHASLLPRWRGAAPIQRALLAGDRETGVAIMQMEAGLDTGPILAERSVAIGPADTAQSLHDRLSRLGAGLLVETLDEIACGRTNARPQAEAGVTYAAKVDKSEALIDWTRDAEQISRQVRAFYPWPMAQTRSGGAPLRILEAESTPSERHPPNAAPAGGMVLAGTVLAASGEGIDVQCGRGVLRIRKLQLAGRKSLTAREFLQGSRLPPALGA